MQLKNALVAGLLTVTCSASPSHPKPTHAPALGQKSWVNYTTVPGFFLQDEEATNPTGFDYVCPHINHFLRSQQLTEKQTQWNFGLLNRTYPTDKKSDSKKLTQWQRFENYVDYLNDKSGRNVNYKVLFMGRHGEGYHNAAESYFGTPAWNVCTFAPF